MIGCRDTIKRIMETIDWRKHARREKEKALLFMQELFHRTYSIKLLFSFFVIAFFFGLTIKSFINDRYTIGFDDYRLAKAETLVDLNALQKTLIKNGGSLATTSTSSHLKGESCSPEKE